MSRWIAVLAVMLALASRAQAQTCTASATAMSFGIYNPLPVTPDNITASVSVSCTAIVAITFSYTIELTAGTGGSFAARSMLGPAGRLNYQLYRDFAHTAIWGDGTAGTTTIVDGYLLLALGTAMRTYTVYGQIPARQLVNPGTYSDVLTILVIY